jgi:AcrR family transcriptional regulator
VLATPVPDESEKESGPRARRRAQSRARLLQAAKEIFEEKGFLAVRVSDIAERAGVSHGLFYHYFDSKHEAFRELATAVDQQLIDSMEVALDRSSTATLQERLQQSIHVNFERYRRNARMIAVIAEVSRYDPEVRAARNALHLESRERLTWAIQQLQRRGLADARIDPTIAATALESMAAGFAERWFVDGDLDCDFDQGVEQFTVLVMNVLQCNQRADAASTDGAKP